jgi:hypothetical protein
MFSCPELIETLLQSVDFHRLSKEPLSGLDKNVLHKFAFYVTHRFTSRRGKTNESELRINQGTSKFSGRFETHR